MQGYAHQLNVSQHDESNDDTINNYAYFLKKVEDYLGIPRYTKNNEVLTDLNSAAKYIRAKYLLFSTRILLDLSSNFMFLSCISKNL